MREALGDDYTTGMSCSDLGAAIRKATVGSVPGQHSLRQAQATKDVLIAVEGNLEGTEGRLDPTLSAPLAESLADYAADTDVMLGIGNADYFANSFPAKPAWEDTEGVHMAVPRTSLLRAVRAVSQEPTAYVILRMAATRHAADGLAAPPARNARTLGALDAVADDVRRDLGEDRASRWERDVLEGLTEKASEPPSYTKDPVNHLLASWQRSLLSDGAENSSTTLEEQSADMVDTWAKALKLDSKVQNSLRKDSLDSSYHARSDTLHALD